MSYKIYHNSRCSKSREALEVLKNLNEPIEILDYLNTPISFNEIEDLLLKLKLEPEKIIRKNESIYKENYKNKLLSKDDWINAIITNPKLLQRPIIIKDNKAVIGRPAENIYKL